MSEKKLDFEDGLGDIDSILHNQSISDLSWLAVDEEVYRASEALPKQNLDMIPELTQALTYSSEEDIPHAIPLKPHVMVNRNPLDAHEASKRDLSTPIRNRVAKYVMEGINNSEIHKKLLLEYSPVDIRNASALISEVLSESGLLGNVYINASHFPRCAQEDVKDRKFLTACAKASSYILKKGECNGCVKNINGRCASLKRDLVDEVPYGSKLAAHYAPQLAAEKRVASFNDDTKSWKEKMRIAFLSSPTTSNPDGVKHVAYQAKLSLTPVSDSEISDYVDRQASSKRNFILSSDYRKFATRMMEGYNDISTMRSASSSELDSLSKEYGLLGHTYLDMDVLGGCKKTLFFIKANKLSPKYIIRRNASCGLCKNLPDGGCAELCGSHNILGSIPEFSRNDLIHALESALKTNRISSKDMQNAISRVSANADFKFLISAINLHTPKIQSNSYSSTKYKGFYGGDSGKIQIEEDEVRRFISHLMNTGLKGTDLNNAVLSRYAKSDISHLKSLGSRLAAEESVQGTHYIDPTAYLDYGHGCSEGSSIFKNRSPKNIMASAKCTGCTLQLSSGWCSRYAKNLIRSVPEDVREAAKRVSLPIYREAAENPVEKYELATEVMVDLNGSKASRLPISFDDFGFDE